MTRLESDLDIGDRVWIDGEGSIVGTVTAIIWRLNMLALTYEVSWIHNGVAQCANFEHFRLKKG